ncbi:MAG: SHOCT domain-containing protein [Sphingomicrobium sp.]
MTDQAHDFGNGAARIAQLTDVVIEQIRKLAELHEQAILTDEEFNAKKTELLSRI